MINVSESAHKQIKEAASRDEMKGLALRLAVRQDESGSFEYGIGFDEIKDNDIRIEQDGITLIIAPAFKDVLEGMTVDYVEIEPGKFHFIFINPNDPNHVAPDEERGNLNS